MAQLDLDEASLEKLAWIIAEEFVESRDQIRRLESVDRRNGKEQDAKLKLVLAWGNPAIALPSR